MEYLKRGYFWLLTLLSLMPELRFCLAGGLGTGVKTPSASSANSFSMSSSLFSLPELMSSENEFELTMGTEECRVKNLKQQQKMSMAKLDAHRCLIRDVAVQVPAPPTLIATFVHPSHVVVQRCTGLCLERPGCECTPKKVRHHKVNIVVGANSTQQMCATIEIEEHRGPCRCKCTTKNCHYNKVFDRDACLCRCKDEFANVKRECALAASARDAIKIWDEETCSCKCVPRVCVEGYYQDRLTCECKPVETSCSAIGVRGPGTDVSLMGSEPKATHASKYIGLSCVGLIALAMVLTLYYMVSKRRDSRSLRATLSGGVCGLDGLENYRAECGNLPGNLTGVGSHGSLCGTLRSSIQPHTTAYTITINSQSASNLDDAIVPLTEDKTRF